jgi:phosphoribosylformylglycinamidine synthase PurS subunit
VKALVHVTLKPDVLDPQGKAIARASGSLGYDAVQSVRQGKLFEVSLDAGDPERARTQLDDLCAKLLANPVIEDYEIVRVED